MNESTSNRPPLAERLKASLQEALEWTQGERRLKGDQKVEGEWVESEDTGPLFLAQRPDTAIKQYAVIYTWTGNNWSAHSPDVPGVVATAKTRAEIEAKFKSALEFHFEGLREDGLPLPEPKSEVGTVEIAA